MMDPDPPVGLVMEPNFFVRFILVSRDLDPIHPEIGVAQARFLRVFRINLGECDVGPAILGPADQLWEFTEGGLVFQDGAARDFFWPEMPEGPGKFQDR